MSRSFRKLLRRVLCGCLVLAVASGLPARAIADDGQQPSPEQIEFFQQKVRPILQTNCFQCHGGGERAKGGLVLASRESILRGGDSGPAVDLQNPDASLLIDAINYRSYEMPPKGKLQKQQIDILTEWVRMGVPWPPGDDRPAEVAARHEPQINDQTRSHWAFQPVRCPPVPRVEPAEWAAGPIDAFVLQKLAEVGLNPNEPAGRAAWLRRATYDLIGLPPTPDEVMAYLQDGRPDARDRVVDRLLASPHYGEKWGRHWLDLVRYAETNSYERDGAKPFVWRFRDYVIRSFNEDKPYDRFVLEQLAGDELVPVTPESIIATGYYRLGVWQDEPVDPEQELYEDLDDLVRTTGEVFLGLTLGCARCHNHKIDPIPQRDYYRFLAFFRNVRRYGVRSHQTVLDASVRVIASEQEQRRHARLVEQYQQQLAEVEAVIQSVEKRVRKDLQGVERDDWKTESMRPDIVRRRVPRLIAADEFRGYLAAIEQRDRLREQQPPGLDQALCVKEHGRTAPETYVLVRGNAHVLGERVEPGFPEVLSPPEPQIERLPPQIDSSGRRLALARWIVSPENPLTARVMANRIWQYHFGRGIVRSPNNFGLGGDRPTHPELLDWLASELVCGGWQLKPLHRRLMLSSAYGMSSRSRPEASQVDPQNDRFWRFDMRRLTAEEIRDSILAVNGRLNLQMFGPSVYEDLPQAVLATQSRPGAGWGHSPPDQQSRRTVYIHVKRSLILPLVASFDGPDVDASCPVRFVTTQPTQALGMLNGEFVGRHAHWLAEELVRQAGSSLRDCVQLGLWRVWQRPPTAAEVEQGVRLVRRLQEQHQVDRRQALDYFALLLLNMNEFVYVD